MSINDATGAIQHNVPDAFENIETASAAVQSQVGDPAGSFFGGTASYGADFAGIASDKLEDFNTAVDTYRDAAIEILNGFDTQKANIEKAFKGSAADSLQKFFTSIKNLCNAYVTAINTEKTYLLEVNQNWISTTAQISSDIETDAGVVDAQKDTINLQ
ncbi:MAG: hypothetical protein K5837_01210 [Candidatus Saccharibacteria bacterium]|nr:hypothetical protein [Candidatus Saccharibacteria bacterium]